MTNCLLPLPLNDFHFGADHHCVCVWVGMDHCSQPPPLLLSSFQPPPPPFRTIIPPFLQPPPPPLSQQQHGGGEERGRGCRVHPCYEYLWRLKKIPTQSGWVRGGKCLAKMWMDSSSSPPPPPPHHHPIPEIWTSTFDLRLSKDCNFPKKSTKTALVNQSSSDT